MKHDRLDLRRRKLLACGIGVTAAVALAFVERDAAAKTSKASLLYQEQPNGGKRCADCKFFSAASGAEGAGTCALVEGPIDRNGWCMAFSPRS